MIWMGLCSLYETIVESYAYYFANVFEIMQGIINIANYYNQTVQDETKQRYKLVLVSVLVHSCW